MLDRSRHPDYKEAALNRLRLAAVAVFGLALLLSPSTLLAAKSVKDYGAVCNSVADDTIALQTACQTAPNFSALSIPDGGCRITGTVDCGGRSISLVADTPGQMVAGTGTGAVIFGDVAGPLWSFVYPANNVSVTGVGFRNTNAAGTGLKIGGVGVSLSRLYVTAFIAIDSSSNMFTGSIRDSVIRWSFNTPGSVGILTGGHMTLRSLDIVGFDNGVRAFGADVSIGGCRIEVNNIGLNLGQKEDGSPWILSASTISGNTFEANDEAIRINQLTSSSIRDTVIYGSVNSPSHQSLYGIRCLTGSFVAAEISSTVISGWFSVAAFAATQGTPNQVTFSTIKAVNLMPLPAKSWLVTNPALWTFFNTNYAP